jgi:hypothetical protein
MSKAAIVALTNSLSASGCKKKKVNALVYALYQATVYCLLNSFQKRKEKKRKEKFSALVYVQYQAKSVPYFLYGINIKQLYCLLRICALRASE